MNGLPLHGITIDWGRVGPESYLRHIPALQGMVSLEFTRPVTFFVGENGSGNSTLLEAIAIAWGFNPEGGTKNYSFSTHDSHSELWEALGLARGFRRAGWGYFLRAESFYNVATQEEAYADVDHPSAGYHLRSHGESFLAALQGQMRPDGLYIFDEPEAALSPQNQLALLLEMHTWAGQGAQFLTATHSPILLGLPGAEILTFDQGPVHPCAYEETGSYQVTEMFINHRAQLLGHLLGPAAT